ncbi:hypothetical protein D3C71_1765160 [compost metagenome]
MQADVHHLGVAFLAFFVEHVERVLEIGEELVAGVETLVRRKAHVVGVECVGDDQMRLVGRQPRHPIGQLIRIGIGGIEEPALFENELQRVA